MAAAAHAVILKEISGFFLLGRFVGWKDHRWGRWFWLLGPAGLQLGRLVLTPVPEVRGQVTFGCYYLSIRRKIKAATRDQEADDRPC